MKIIEKERTQVQKYTIYEAADGCTFDTKEEWEKYEQTAKFVLRTKMMRMVVEEGTECKFFSCGYDENTVYAIKVESGADADILFQLYALDNPYVRGTDKACEEHRNRIQSIIYGSIGDILLMAENYDGEIYIIDSRKNVINRLNKLTDEDN